MKCASSSDSREKDVEEEGMIEVDKGEVEEEKKEANLERREWVRVAGA